MVMDAVVFPNYFRFFLKEQKHDKLKQADSEECYTSGNMNLFVIWTNRIQFLKC